MNVVDVADTFILEKGLEMTITLFMSRKIVCLIINSLKVKVIKPKMVKSMETTRQRE